MDPRTRAKRSGFITLSHRLIRHLENGPPWVRRSVFATLIFLHDLERCDLVKFSYAMAYITLFSLIPALAAIFTMISFFLPLMGEHGSLLIKIKSFVLSNLAAGTGDQVITYFDRFLANRDLKKIGILQFAFTVVTLAFLLRQIEMALNHVFLIKKTRHIVTRFVYFWTFLTLGTFTLSLGIGIAADFDIMNLIPFMGSSTRQGSFLSHMFPPLAMFTLYFLIYKLVPNCSVGAKNAAIGAAVAALIQTIASNSYGFILSTFFKSYPAIYGALAAVPAFLLWLFVLWAITLIGAVVTWRLEQKMSFDEAIRFVTHADSATVTDDDGLVQHQKEAIIPYVCLLAIHRAFLKGQGQGISGLELAHRLHLPKALVLSGLKALIKAKLITPNDTREITAEDNLLDQRFFPTRPSEQLSLQDVNSILWQDMGQWLQVWNRDLGDAEVTSICDRMHNMAHGLKVEVSLANLLKEGDTSQRTMTQRT